MKAPILLLIAIVYFLGLSAQQKTFVIVKAGNNIMNVLSTADVFYFPQFTPGTVFLRDGTATTAPLNYNRLVDEMHFISPKGDTLALADEKNIKYVAVGNDTFFYDGGYLRVLSSGNLLKSAIKQIWIIADSRQVGAYNTTNPSVSMTSFKSYNEGGRLYDLTVNEDLILKRTENYYFGNNDNHFVLARKRELLSLLPKQQRQIEMYLKENKIDFSKKEDIDKIVQFINRL